MCRHCENGESWCDNYDDFGPIEWYIVFYKRINQWFLEVRSTNYETDTEIIYCPKCGRKLPIE